MKSKTTLCLLSIFALSACEKQTVPLQWAGAAAGAVVGGYAGAHLGGGLGQWAYIAGGTLVGGAGGYEVGRILDESDLVFYQSSAQKALASNDYGSTENWENPETGNSGVFRPSQSFQALNGQTCRHFRSTVAFADAVETGEGTACHQSDGRWQIISNYFG